MSEQLSLLPDDPLEPQCPRHDYYDDLMGGARRKPAMPIGGPAVTRHVAFWCPSDPMSNRANWVSAIEKFILALYHHLKDHKLDPRTRSLKDQRLYLLENSYSETDPTGDQPKSLRKGDEGATRYQTVRLRFFYGSRPVSIGFELHDEYLTFSAILDLAWPPQAMLAATNELDR